MITQNQIQSFQRLLEEDARRTRLLKEPGADYERGPTYFYRFVLAFLLLEVAQKDGFEESVPSFLDRLANSHQEIQESLSKLEGHQALSRGFAEELGFFLQFLDRVGGLGRVSA